MNSGRSYRIEIRRADPTGDWYWRVVAGNGRVILTSETYSAKDKAVKSARAFAGSPTRALFLRIESE